MSGYVMMTQQVAPNPLAQHLPTKSWVRFLRTYGPTPNNATMFDEHVSKAARSAKVAPIELSIPLLSTIVDHIKHVESGSIVIAGTAGDGKTYHCRALWHALGGSQTEWSTAENRVKQLKLIDGRDAYFVKDLSELTEPESNFILDLLEQSVLKNDNQKVLVIAANHGQILERLRKRLYENQVIHPLRYSLEQVFLQTGDGHIRLKVFDLSRSNQRKSFTDVLDVLVDHPEWEKCQSCHFQVNGHTCPIFENRKRLLGLTDESKQLRSRVADLIDLARLNGAHLPVRDLLALCANIILGHPDVKDGLMRCDDVEKVIKTGTFFKASLYDNIMGANLPNHRVAERPAFQAIASFQIGSETTNQVDGLLIYGQYDQKLESDYEQLIAADSFYGATSNFKSAQDAYLEGDEQAREVVSQVFMRLLKSQRRRLFFTMPSNAIGQDYFWYLSSYQNAGLYLVLLRSLQNKGMIAELTRQLIVRGLNRIMTGMLVDGAENIFVTTSGGFTESKVSVLCNEEIAARTSRRCPDGMSIKLNSNNKPFLEFRLKADEHTVTFELSPIRFEFLARVASGALPNSFSSECLEDLLALKSKLLRRVEHLQQEELKEVGSNLDNNILSLRFVAESSSSTPKNIFVRLN